MPDGTIAVLRLIDTIQSLSNAVDGVVVGLCSDIPLLPLELLKLILSLKTLDQNVPVEGNAGLLLDELPALFDLLHAVLLDQRIVEQHGHGQNEQRLVEEPVLKDGGGDGSVACFVAGDDQRRVVGDIVLNKDAGFSLTHRAGVTGQTDGLHSVNVVENCVAVDVAGDEVGDHLHGDVLKLV